MKANSARLFAASGILIFLALSIALIYARGPWWDEGFLAGPSANLAASGVFGSHVLSYMVPSGDRYLYWNVPLYFTILAAWFRIFGFGIHAMRFLSLLCALFALGSWYVIVLRLLNNKLAAALTVFLLCTDYVFVLCAVDGRMDMMTAAFGLAGLAAYLSIRDSNFNRAVFLGAAGVAAAAFSHPLGLIYAGVLLFTSLYLDWRRIRFRHVLLSIVPFAIAAAAWGLYILQSPRDFLAQIHVYANRVHPALNPVEIVWKEITARYWMFYYTLPSKSTESSLAVFKTLGLIPYVAGFLLALTSRRLRSDPRGRLLIFLLPVAMILLALGDAAKFPHYFIHVFPFSLALLAVAGAFYWEQGNARLLLLGLFGFAVAMGCAGLLAKIRLNDFAKVYEPAVASILPYMTASTLVDGPCELIFGLGDAHVIDGMSQESYRSHKPDFVVLAPEFGAASLYEPSKYELIYRNPKYAVYRQKPR